MKPDDKIWAVIKNNDTKLDGRIWYAVTSTKIFCKPSCHSRLPKRDNVNIYDNYQDAMNAGYRPCKRCRPTEKIVTNDVWVDEINYILEKYYMEKLTLKEISLRVHGSESHLRHVYQQETGLTPLQKLNNIRLSKSKELLKKSTISVGKIGMEVGIPNVSYFIKLFKHTYSISPYQYRIDYAEN